MVFERCWEGFWGNERREKAKTKKQRRESHHLGVERVLSVASHSVRNSLLWHLARLVHMVPVDLLKHQQFKASAQLISVTWMSAMPLASAILSAWALGRLDEEQSRQAGQAADKKSAAAAAAGGRRQKDWQCVWPSRARRQNYKRAAVAKYRWHSVVALQSQGVVPLSNDSSNFIAKSWMQKRDWMGRESGQSRAGSSENM